MTVSYEQNNEPWDSVECGEFPEEPLKEDYDPCN